MKRRILLLLVLPAVLSLLLFGFLPLSGGSLLELLALPLVWIAKGLRLLSLSGSFGNSCAIALYVLLCLAPLLGLLRQRKPENWLLALCSVLLFGVLYGLINPGLLPPVLQGSVGAAICAGSIWAVLLCWLCLRLLRACREGTLSLYGSLRLLLLAAAVLWMLAGFGLGMAQWKAAMAQVRQGNTAPGLNLLPTDAMLTARFLLGALEATLDALLLVRGADLLSALEQDPYSGACRKAGLALEQLGQTALLTLLACSLLLYLAQLLLAPWLYAIHTVLRLPLASLILMFAAMVLTRLLRQGQSLKEENDLFV